MLFMEPLSMEQEVLQCRLITRVYKFVESFLTAIRPQVTKSYAAGDYKRMADLVCYGSCYGCYLYLLLGIPLFIEIEWVLKLWLGECPQHTAMFLRIMMIELLFQTMGHLTGIAMQATGRMKEVNLTVAVVLLCIVPMSYVLSKLGYSPEVVLAANVVPWVIVPHIRIHWLKKFSGGFFPIHRYTTQVLFKTTVLAVIMFIPPFFLHESLTMVSPFVRFLFVCTASVLTSSIVIYYCGMNKENREKVVEKIKGIILKIRHK